MSNFFFAGQLFLRTTFSLLFTFVLASPAAYAQVDEDEPCLSAVADAEKLFFNAEFEPAIKVLKDCLDADEADKIQRAQMYFLLSRIYFADQDEAHAAEALIHYFDLRPDSELDSFLPPPFLEFAEHIREITTGDESFDSQLVPLPEISEDTRRNYKRWALIGGSGIFAIATVAIMSSGRSSTADRFPPVPGPPSGQ